MTPSRIRSASRRVDALMTCPVCGRRDADEIRALSDEELHARINRALARLVDARIRPVADRLRELGINPAEYLSSEGRQPE